MITIATGDLTGVLADVVPFVFPKPDLPAINCLRLEWDGQLLHALGTDLTRIAISSWAPDDEPDQDIQDSLFMTPGGDDEPWSTLITLDDAKDIVSNYKLGLKEQGTPLQVDYDQANDRLKVIRSRDTGHSAITMVIEGRSEEFPDLRKQLADCDVVEKVDEIAYSAKAMADFGKVRQRGALVLTFTGTNRPTLVTIGERFTGAIQPVRLGKDAAA